MIPDFWRGIVTEDSRKGEGIRKTLGIGYGEGAKRSRQEVEPRRRRVIFVLSIRR